MFCASQYSLVWLVSGIRQDQAGKGALLFGLLPFQRGQPNSWRSHRSHEGVATCFLGEKGKQLEAEID